MDHAARKFYLEPPLIGGGTTGLHPLQWVTWQGRADNILVRVGSAWRLRDNDSRLGLMGLAATHLELRDLGGSANAGAAGGQYALRRKLVAYLVNSGEVDVPLGLLEALSHLLVLTEDSAAPQVDRAADLETLHGLVSVSQHFLALVRIKPDLLVHAWRRLFECGYAIDQFVLQAEGIDQPLSLLEATRMLMEINRYAEAEAVARMGLERCHRDFHEAFSESLAAALYFQKRFQEALALLTDPLRRWTTTGVGLPPAASWILLALIADNVVEMDVWRDAVLKMAHNVLHMDLLDDPVRQLQVLCGLVTVSPMVMDLGSIERLAACALALSVHVPHPLGPRANLLCGYFYQYALRATQRFEEAVASGQQILVRSIMPFEGYLMLRGRCERELGMAYIAMSRFTDAALWLEKAIADEPVSPEDIMPLLTSSTFLVSCAVQLSDKEKQTRWIQVFAENYRRNPTAAAPFLDLLRKEFEQAGQKHSGAELDRLCGIATQGNVSSFVSRILGRS